MRRGDIYLVNYLVNLYFVNLETVRGAETDKTRPVVLVSNDGANLRAEQNRRGTITVVPVTSNVARVHPFQVAIAAGDSGLAVDAKARAEQIRAVDVQRFGRRLGALDAATLRQLDRAIRIHLAL
jgi:mRNA interferase MazF